MEAIIVGIKKLDYESAKGPVKATMYYVNHPGEEMEGYEAGEIYWNELKKGAPPNHAIGEIIEVETGRYGLKFPAPRISDMFKISIERNAKDTKGA
jgi:hypothetical protein